MCMCAGHDPPEIPLPRRRPTLHAHEHQDRRLLRRLLLLRAIFPSQHRAKSHQALLRRLRARSRTHRQREWFVPLLHGRRVERHARPQDESAEYQGDGHGCAGAGDGGVRDAGHD